MDSYSRRKFLGTCATTGVLGIAGCLGTGSGSASQNTGGSKSDDSGDEVGDTYNADNIQSLESEKISDTQNDWPMYQKDTRNTGRTSSKAPNVEPGVRWELSQDGRVKSGPIVSNGSVYYANYGSIVAVNAGDGSSEWVYSTEGQIKAMAAVDSEKVYVGSDDTRLHAVNAETGQKEWSFKTKDSVFSPPTTIDDTVYFGSTDGKTYAIDKESGEELWNFKAPVTVSMAPAYEDGEVYIVADHVYDLDAETGELLWKHETDFELLPRSIAVADKKVYFGDKSGNVHTLNSKNGEKIWRFDTESQVSSSPCLGDRTIYFGNDDAMVYAVDDTKAEEKWSFEAEESMRGSPILTDDTLYFGSYDFNVYALDIEKGEPRWRFKTEKWPTSPAIGDGILYFVTDKVKVYAFEEV